MSFSGKVREELATKETDARHCNLAELSALMMFSGDYGTSKKGEILAKFHTESYVIARKYFTLIEKTFNIKADIIVRRNNTTGNCSYYLYARGKELAAMQNAMTQAVCCKRAFIRGAFMAAGSISDPKKSYHFEIVCGSSEAALKLQKLICDFDLDAKIVGRKKFQVVYLKEGAQIVDILNVMEAHVALMELENLRIYKEISNSVNRKVNCETANLGKTVSAAVRQMEDITLIRDTIGFERLPEGLRDVALTRLENQEASLKELGALLQNPIGKSGVNHRLRKLSEIAEKLRDNQGGHTEC